MSLNGSLQIGRSALLSSQTALQVAGDNMANAATPGFHRRTVHMTPLQGSSVSSGHFMGQGVQLSAIRREIDTALQSRYRAAISEEHASLVDQRFLTAMETLQNELTDNDLSSMLSTFFNSFSELANNPTDTGMRSVVIQQAQSLADRVVSLRSDYGRIGDEINRTLDLSVSKANDLLDQIAALNEQITAAEIGQGEAASLRDQRDLLLDELSQYVDISVIEHSSGSVDVLVGSMPVLLGATSRGIELRSETVDGRHELSVRVAANGANLNVRSGSIGGLLDQQARTVNGQLDALDEFAGQLIFQVNRLHSQGQGTTGFHNVLGTYQVKDADAALNSAAAGLPFDVVNGSFFLHVTHNDSGVRTAHEINVNGDMSLNDLINQINTVVNVPHVTASVGHSGKFQLDADANYSFSFSDDASGVLAVLGINTFFAGDNASNMDLNQHLVNDPSRLSAGFGHVAGSNGTAKAIAELQNQPISDLGGKSLRQFWQQAVTSLAVKTNAANSAVESSRMVRENLSAQVQSVSGVSLDEESINLLLYQRQFQAAARYIGVIDETLRTLMAL